MEQHEPRWWQTGVVYEIYPRSFADSNGDGTGDLAGIIGRLDYLQWLGVDAIWIAPFYPSPMADFGYDVADYTDVDPLFGTMADLDALLAAAHERGIRVVIDYVPNHTSDQHPWFVESRSSRSSPKRDWYFWRDPKPNGERPNNWISMFGGPSWEWDEATGQFYLHTFLREQPDLNWRNPEVRAAMFDAAQFWLDRGVDGFRIDVAPAVMKDPELRDNPSNPEPRDAWRAARLGTWLDQLHVNDLNHPDMHELYRSFRALIDGYPGDRVHRHAQPLKQGRVGVIAGHREDGVGRNPLQGAAGQVHHFRMGRGDRLHPGVPAGPDASLLHPVDDIRQDPGLYGSIEAFPEMHQRYRGAGPPAFERRVHAAVARADDDHPLMPVRVTFHEVMGHVRKIFTWNAEEVRVVEVPGCEHNRRGVIRLGIVPARHFQPKAI